jgi:uncharacterized phiE125 gp8 family phage protein
MYGFQYQTGLVQTPIEQDYPYFLLEPAANYPISLVEARVHLKIDADDAYSNTYIDFIIKAATSFAEKYTGLDFIQKKYLTFRDSFSYPMTLRRGPFSLQENSIVFKYILNGVWTAVPTTSYQIQYLKPYAKILATRGGNFNYSTDDVAQAIRIEFIAGFGATKDSVPDDLRLGLLNHIAAIYENRGDADEGTSGFASTNFAETLPIQTKNIYNSYKIIETH